MILNLKNTKPADVQNYLQHAIAPRPICFASTIDQAGNVNLSPFSFFNLFSSNPPIVVFLLLGNYETIRPNIPCKMYWKCPKW
jgi:flavin reductase (DIM6/NTAB) family NADH-FMN oxidoreductase RutF